MENPMTTRRPAEVFPPGEFLREELDYRGWTQADLAEILGRPQRLVSEIISGKRGISPETAKGLAAALGTSPEFWMNLEASYQLWRSGTGGDGGDDVARRAKVYGFAPIKDMMRRGWIEASENVDVLENQLREFFEVNSLDEEPQFLPHAARKSTSYSEPSATRAQKAWLFRAKKLAGAVHVGPYARSAVDDAIQKLKLLLHAPQEVRRIPRILSDSGIRFVIVEALPKTKIDGACFWLDDSPVVVMSLRFDRIDNFWFTLLHELGHVSAGVSSLDVDLERTLADDDRPQSERDADAFASEHLIPQGKLQSFIARVRPLYSIRRIEAFAETVQVHPGIVIGQLQHHGEVSWAGFRRTLVAIRIFVIDAALTDGWGSRLPVQL